MEKILFKLYKYFRNKRTPLSFKNEVGSAWWADEERDLVQIEVNPRSDYTVRHYCLLEITKEEAEKLYKNLGNLLS
jgi:hypothetical protein